MASEQFSLCWDNFHKNMSSGMNSLLENEDLVDVTLAVEGRCLKAHKMVLSVCSPYFRELFKSNPCKHPIVFMKDVSYVAMSDLLQFMYQGEVQVSQENLTTFIKTAEALQIKGLTGDGNGSNDCDNEQDDVNKAPEIETPKPTPPPPRPTKKPQHAPTPPAKRPRLSVAETATASASHAVAKTEPAAAAAAVASASSSDNLIQFKMEPYDHSQSAVTIADDNAEESSFADDPLDEANAEDGNEDYSMMEGADEEPQAGTSADGTAGEGQDYLCNVFVKAELGDYSHCPEESPDFNIVKEQLRKTMEENRRLREELLRKTVELNNACSKRNSRRSYALLPLDGNHWLSKIPRTDGKKICRRCSECYRKMSCASGHQMAAKRAKRVDTECLSCKKTFCVPCFEELHQKVL